VDNRREKDYDRGMSTQPRTPTPRMTVEEFLAWAEGRPGRHELVRGEVIAQAAERAAHWEVKLATHVALLAAIKAKTLPCHVVPDGATVRIDEATAYEPDAMVYCGPKPPPSALLVENPVIIVEVLSPSTGRRDQGRKLADYFRLPSVAHYLIIDPDDVLVIHHQRHGEDILTRICREGTIALDPPGIEVAVGEIYGVGSHPA
jgi:Uma2 family endonuclease